MENRVNKKAKFASFQKGTKIEIALCNLTAAFQNQVLKSTWRTQFGHYIIPRTLNLQYFQVSNSK